MLPVTRTLRWHSIRDPDTLLTTMSSLPSPIRVLVVDDDEMSRELLTVLLEGEGYAVHTAESGEAAMKLLASGPVPDLVLADMQLPGISGAELARGLRGACGSSALLLAISGSQPAAEAVSLFDGFLLKPFQMEEVAAALQAHGSSTAGRAGSRKVRTRKARSVSGSGTPLARVSGHRRSSIGMGNVPQTDSSASQFASKQDMSIAMQAELTTHAGESTGNSEGPTPFPVLNEKIFLQLAGSVPGPQLKEMYALCVEDARQKIAGMRRLADARDDAMFVREAHAIKGGAGMLGATELHRRAADLETRGLAKGSKRETQDVNSLDELSAACDRLERMLGSRL
jgi:CheY-like chemotaxis protein/HPt (histidine-containing phosphotransfer) domain-containing protein